MINIFKRRFSHSKEQDIDDSQNPWAGLASYEDPETAERKLKFCGRDDDSYDLARLIMGNVFVTLYGKSGIGKTSLLNAGVFPEMREEQYTPLSIRLGMRDEEHPQSYQTMIIEAIECVAKRAEAINVIDEQNDQQSIDYLWNYFARHRFYDKNNEPTTPVIVLDQFEEVFRGYRNEAETLLRQLDYLNDKDHSLDNCDVDGQIYRYEQNFRFVVSIREDDLYRLEDSIDNCYLPALKRCRYRLRSLSEEGALDAILIPGDGLFNESERDSIANAIIGKSRNDDGSISTNIISLLCSRIYVDFKKSGTNHITPALVESFIKGNPFERFYNEATQGFSNKEKSYIEEHLVDSTSRRNSIPESDFLLHVKNGAKLLEGKNRILQRISTSSDGKSYRVELIHDSFCEPLAGLKEKREKRRRLLLLTSIAAITLFGILIMSLIGYLVVTNRGQKDELSLKDKELLANAQSLEASNDSLNRVVDLLNREKAVSDSIAHELSLSLAKEKEANEEKNLAISLLEQKNKELEIEKQRVLDAQWQSKGYEAQALSVKANDLIAEDPELACKLALEALPEDVSDPSRPATPEAESLLRMAMRNLPVRTLKGHKNEVNSASFSPDGKYVVTGSRDKTAIIWNAEMGEQVRMLKGHKDYVLSASFSPNGKYVVTGSRDKTAIIWNAETGEQARMLKGHKNSVNSASFSPDGKYVVTGSYDNTAIIWNAETGEQVRMLKGHKNDVLSASFSPDGKYVVTGSWDKTAIIWNAETGEQVRTLKDNSWVTSASFSPDGKYVVTESGVAIIWSAETGEQVRTLKGHKFGVTSASFSPDGKYVVTGSRDKTAIIWNAETGEQVRMLKGHKDYVLSASFSPDGKYVVTGSKDGSVKIWSRDELFNKGNITLYNARDVQMNPASKALLITEDGLSNITQAPFDGDDNRIYAAWANTPILSNDGKRLLACLPSGQVVEWDASTGTILRLFNGFGHGGIFSLSPDGSQIVSASASTIKIMDIESGLSKVFKKCDGTVNDIYFSPDGTKIAAQIDSSTVIWNALDGTLLIRIPCKYVIFSPDNRFMASSLNNKLTIWNAITGTPDWQVDDETYPLEFSPNGQFLLTSNEGSTENSICSVKVWDIKRKKIIKTLLYKDPGLVVIPSYSPQGDKIAVGTGNEGNGIHIWNTETWECTDTIMPRKTEGVFGITFSPDGKKLIVRNDYGDLNMDIRLFDLKNRKEVVCKIPTYRRASYNHDGTLFVSSGTFTVIWNAETGEPVRTLKGHEYDVSSASFSPDGKYVVTGSEDNTAIIWNAETGEQVRTLKGHKYDVNSASFSPDGKYVVTGSDDNTAIIWNAETGEQVRTLKGHISLVNSASFSPDGKYVVTASNGTIIIWDATSYKPVQTFKVNYVDHAFFAPDGRSVIGWGSNGVRIWEFLPLQELIGRTRQLFEGQPLTPEERLKYYLE